MNEQAEKLERVAIIEAGARALRKALGPEGAAKFMQLAKGEGKRKPPNTKPVRFSTEHSSNAVVLRFDRPVQSISFAPRLARKLIIDLRQSLRRLAGDLTPKAEEPN